MKGSNSAMARMESFGLKSFMHNNCGLGRSSIAGAPLAAVYLLGMFIRELKRIPEANDRCGGMC